MIYSKLHSLATLLNSLLANCASSSVSNLYGMPWTANWCFIFLITVWTISCRGYSSQTNHGWSPVKVDEYQVLQSIPVKYVCTHKGPWKVWDCVIKKRFFLLEGFNTCKTGTRLRHGFSCSFLGRFYSRMSLDEKSFKWTQHF